MMKERTNSSAKMLIAFVQRVEHIRADKKELSDDESAVFAEAKAAGFDPKVMRYVVARRAKKPHDLREAEALAETYMAALGMATDAPLFRAVGLMNVDTAQREQVIEALKALVPDGGSITVDAGGGRPVMLTRGKDGEVTVSEVQPLKPAAAPKPASEPAARAERAPPPDVDAKGADALGRKAFRDNVAIIANPFPFNDPRRPRWDFGWRAEGGGDGMGPDE